MADVVPNEGLANLLRLAVRQSVPVKARLYKNDFSPTPASVLADFTEATYSGYAAQEISPMSEPEETPSGKVRSQSAELTFSHNGGVTGNQIYGYFVTLETIDGTKLWFGGRYEGAPLAMQSATDEIVFSVDVLETQEV